MILSLEVRLETMLDVIVKKRALRDQGVNLLVLDLPGDTVDQLTNMTMGQLFYLLGHIQKLSESSTTSASSANVMRVSR